MHPRLDTLVLSEEQRERARCQIQEMAYGKWQQAGCPEHDGVAFWVEAEQEWIEYYYTPDRYLSRERAKPR